MNWLVSYRIVLYSSWVLVSGWDHRYLIDTSMDYNTCDDVVDITICIILFVVKTSTRTVHRGMGHINKISTGINQVDAPYKGVAETNT